jgi:geranylgeranyl pyrophosphate synthase
MNVRSVVRFVTEHGGLDYAAGRARSFSDIAKQQLASFPASASKRALEAFAEFVVEREK